MSDSEATLTNAITYTAGKLRVRRFVVGDLVEPRDGAHGLGVSVTVDLIDSLGAKVAERQFILQTLDIAGEPTPVAVVDFLTALVTAVPGETGSVLRRANYRTLSHLVAKGEIVGTVSP